MWHWKNNIRFKSDKTDVLEKLKIKLLLYILNAAFMKILSLVSLNLGLD